MTLAFGVMFACLVAPHSLLVLFYGLLGSSGNSLSTGAFLTIATVAVDGGLSCDRLRISASGPSRLEYLWIVTP